MVERACSTWLYGSRNVTGVDYCTRGIVWRILDDDVENRPDKKLKTEDVVEDFILVEL